MTWFRVLIEMNLLFVSGGIEIGLVLECTSNLLDIRVGVEINLDFVWGMEIDSFLC